MKTPQPPLGHCLFLNDKCVAKLQKSGSGALGSLSKTNTISLPQIYVCGGVCDSDTHSPPPPTDLLCSPCQPGTYCIAQGGFKFTLILPAARVAVTHHTQLCMVWLASRKKDKRVDLVEARLSTSKSYHWSNSLLHLTEVSQLRHTATVLL